MFQTWIYELKKFLMFLKDMTAVSRQMLQTASANKKDDSVIGEERSYDSPAGSSVNVLAGKL